MCLDRILLAVFQRWAERQRAVVGKTVECAKHSIRHVINEHPGADQYTPELRFIRPLSTVTDLGKAGSEGERQGRVAVFRYKYELRMQKWLVYWKFNHDVQLLLEMFLLFCPLLPQCMIQDTATTYKGCDDSTQIMINRT